MDALWAGATPCLPLCHIATPTYPPTPPNAVARSDSRVEDVTDCFRALDANPGDDNATVEKATFEAYMQENFDLELDSDAVFASGAANSTLCLDDFKRLLLPDSEKGRSKGK